MIQLVLQVQARVYGLKFFNSVQHISTSAHQHISTSAHQHISTSAHQGMFFMGKLFFQWRSVANTSTSSIGVRCR